MSEFKVGDEVRVKTKKEVGEKILENEGVSLDFIERHGGKKGEINSIRPQGGRMIISLLNGTRIVITHHNVLVEKLVNIPEELFKI